jgi:hypothetical protein
MDLNLAVGQPDTGENEGEIRTEERPAPAGDRGVPGSLAELAGRLDKVEEHLAEFHQRAPPEEMRIR